jgi:DNA-binding transcriptional regulator YdaS (Cro superfamily)
MTGVVSVLVAATNQANPNSPGKEDFGQYLVSHQAELAPFFDKNLEELVRKAMPMVWGLLAWITFLTILVGWVVDIGLARGFTPFFAPAYAKTKRAVVYSTVRLIMSLIVMGLMALTVYLSTSFVHAGIIILTAGVLLLIVWLVTQIGWLAYQFRMTVGVSIIFFVIFAGAQALLFILVTSSILVGQPSALAYRFVNQQLAPQLETEVDATKDELATIQKSSDDTRAKIANLQAQMAKDQADQEKLNQQIEEKKNSETYLFQKIVKVEATGDLAGARDQFTAMLAQYPSGALVDSVKAHLAEIDSEMAALLAQKQKAQADALAAAAAARADLLARASRGEVTLSEMRQVLVGKSRADVTNLLGQPSDTASDRWGYGQQMIFNPMTNEKHGLTVFFSDGNVQSVGYYYGVGR